MDRDLVALALRAVVEDEVILLLIWTSLATGVLYRVTWVVFSSLLPGF